MFFQLKRNGFGDYDLLRQWLLSLMEMAQSPLVFRLNLGTTINALLMISVSVLWLMCD